MTTTPLRESFADSVAARIIAIVLAAICAFILFNSYSDDLGRLVSSKPQSTLPATSLETSPEEAANPALAECLQQRVGDVDRMKEEGILSDEKYAAFRSRAEQLCIQQNQ